jgi:hypothetical protein
VNSWRQPISHISSLRDSHVANKKNVLNMFDQNKKNIEEKKVEETPEVKFNQIK